MNKIAVIAAIALLSGCATTSDVVQRGPNRYEVSSMAAPAMGGQAGAQARARDAAGRKCFALGKTMNVLMQDDHWVFPANTNVIVTFECD